MFSGHLIKTPGNPLPYCVVVRRVGEVVRLQPVRTVTEGNRALTQMLREERTYEAELRWTVELDS